MDRYVRMRPYPAMSPTRVHTPSRNKGHKGSTDRRHVPAVRPEEPQRTQKDLGLWEWQKEACGEFWNLTPEGTKPCTVEKTQGQVTPGVLTVLWYQSCQSGQTIGTVLRPSRYACTQDGGHVERRWMHTAVWRSQWQNAFAGVQTNPQQAGKDDNHTKQVF